MLARMPLRLYQEWAEYAAIEPFDAERVELMLAQLCCLVANAMRGKGQRAWQAHEFILKYDRQPGKPRKTPAQMKAIMRAFAAAHNAKMDATVKK